MAAVVMGSPLPASVAAARSPLRNSTFRPQAQVDGKTDEAYAAAESRASQWRRDLTQSVGSEMQRGLRELCRERAHLVDLQADLAAACSNVEAAKQMHADGEQLVEAASCEREAASERSEALTRARDELLRTRDANLEALKLEESEAKRHREEAEGRRAQAEKLLNTYRDRLGFSITREAPHTVRMTFYLDKADPERAFGFTLGLASEEEGTGYNVHDCVPVVPELPALLADLNNNVDSVVALPRFVCSMRRAFLKLVCPAQHKA